MERKVEVPIDINGREYQKLKENLESFNDNAGDKLTFDEFVSLVFETTLIKERLDSKREHLEIIKAEAKELEDELASRYSIGLTGSEEDYDKLIELRKQILKDSSNHINGTY